MYRYLPMLHDACAASLNCPPVFPVSPTFWGQRRCLGCCQTAAKSAAPLERVGRLITGHVMCLQDGISKLQNLEVLEIVGASSLRVEPGMGQLPNLMSLEFNSCE